MHKAEMIAKYGEEWYENYKAKARANAYRLYHADIEKARKDRRERSERRKDKRQEYAKARRVVYRINSRDSLRLLKMGLLKEGYEAHHVKYHADVKDASWIDDVVIMTKEGHKKWHLEHPEFNALDNVV